MTSVPASVIHRHLETTLQLLVSLSSTMAIDDILMARIRLTEANIVLGHMVIERETAANRKWGDTLQFCFSILDHRHRRS